MIEDNDLDSLLPLDERIAAKMKEMYEDQHNKYSWLVIARTIMLMIAPATRWKR